MAPVAVRVLGPVLLGVVNGVTLGVPGGVVGACRRELAGRAKSAVVAPKSALSCRCEGVLRMGMVAEPRGMLLGLVLVGIVVWEEPEVS